MRFSPPFSLLRTLPGIPGRKPYGWTPDEGEEVVREGSGALKRGRQDRMRWGRLVLTDRRLVLVTAKGTREQIALGDILDLAIEKLRYLLRNRDTVVLSLRPAGGRTRRIFVCVDKAQAWRENIFELTRVKLTAPDVEMVAAGLSEASAVILRYVWAHEHARIDALAKAYEAPSHMDVLLRIRKEINPTAEGLTGYPILVFRGAGRANGGRGERGSYSWWISGKGSGRRDAGMLFDVFDEGDHLQVVVDGLKIGLDDIRLNLTGDRLTLLVRSPSLLEIGLPCPVVLEDTCSRLHNGILVVSLRKANNASAC